MRRAVNNDANCMSSEMGKKYQFESMIGLFLLWPTIHFRNYKANQLFRRAFIRSLAGWLCSRSRPRSHELIKMQLNQSD